MQNSVTCENWLITLKDKFVSKPKQEWSEEDEDKFNEIKTALNGFYCEGNAEELTNWLKSLRHQSYWKPSDEQMKQLGWIAEQNKDNMIGKELMSLYQDLLKLKG